MAETKHNGHATETPDVSYIKNIDVTREVSDVYVLGIVKFVIELSALMVASFFLMWVLFRSVNYKTSEPRPSPMALTEKDRLPPEPRLQGAPGFGERLEKEVGAKESPEPSERPEAKPSPTPKDPLWEIKAVRDQWDDVLKNRLGTQD